MTGGCNKTETGPFAQFDSIHRYIYRRCANTVFEKPLPGCFIHSSQAKSLEATQGHQRLSNLRSKGGALEQIRVPSAWQPLCCPSCDLLHLAVLLIAGRTGDRWLEVAGHGIRVATSQKRF